MAIDRNKIIAVLSKVRTATDRAVIIPALDGLIKHIPAEFWTLYSKNLVEDVPKGIQEAVGRLLVSAAQERGYHTGYGLITSKEWETVVRPMVQGVEDVLHGAYAVFAAWGWADSEIVELVPGERMVVRVYDYSGAEMAELYPNRRAPRVLAHMINGVSAALMDLVYGGPYDPEGRTGLFTFWGKQVKGLETGDPCGEFVVIKADRSTMHLASSFPSP